MSVKWAADVNVWNELWAVSWCFLEVSECECCVTAVWMAVWNKTSQMLSLCRVFITAFHSYSYITHRGQRGRWGWEVSCGGHHQQRGKTTMGSALDGAVFDFTQVLAYLVHNMSRSHLYLGFGHFCWLPSFFWGVGGAVRFLVVGTIGQEERPPRGQLWMEQCLTSLKYWPI